MLAWLLSREKPRRAELLAAVPVRNALVKERPMDSTGELGAMVLRLVAPLEPGPLRGIFSRGRRSTKSFDLDALGAFVWDAIDGRHTVEALIGRFASEQRVNLREAEVAVLAFLKTLVQRKLIALAVPGDRRPAANDPPRKRKRARQRR